MQQPLAFAVMTFYNYAFGQEGFTMMARRGAVMLGLLLLARLSFCADEPVKVTTFEMNDGRKYQALNWSSFGSSEYKTYIVATLDGHKTMLLAKDVARHDEQMVAIDTLPADAKIAVAKYRAQQEIAKANAEAAAKQEQIISEARKGLREAESQLSRAKADLNEAKNLITTAQETLKNNTIEHAAAEAKYDAAKTELSAGSAGYVRSVSFVRGPGSDNYSRSDTLRNAMVKAAEDKARIEMERKDAEAVIARTKDAIKPLSDRVAEMEKARDAAKAQSERIIKEAKAAEKERTDKVDGELLIGKKP